MRPIAALLLLLVSGCAEPPLRPDWDTAPAQRDAAPREEPAPPSTEPASSAEPQAEPRRDGSRVSLHPAGVPSPLFAALDQHAALHPVEKRFDDWRTHMPPPPELLPFRRSASHEWVLQTNRGTLRFRLRPDIAPRHVASTMWLTRAGFYDGLSFHRVIPGFMAQGGCPVGDGTGGPGYDLSGEFPPDGPGHHRRGVLSAANAGPDTDGSQFFVTFAAAPWLDGKFTVFGEMIDGEEVLATVEALGTPAGTPKSPIRILRADVQVR